MKVKARHRKDGCRNKKRNSTAKKKRRFIKKNSDLSQEEKKHLNILDESESEDAGGGEIEDVTFQAVLVKKKISLPQAIVIAKLRRDKRMLELEIDNICDQMQQQLNPRSDPEGAESCTTEEYPEIQALAQNINKLYIKNKGKKRGRSKRKKKKK
eukprot:TRINITY_DN3471_c0_g1_i6.p1 TRINITY_DN3471_c0_g1~~TRINITY_DN3471_c0_g1_i6.p1  ORF type:complete len:155 (+),score=47.30 TRINITY_DN3471_c0_g1_i6:162-626(+)